jgi:hypothetical protein
MLNSPVPATAARRISELVENFAAHEKAFLAETYSEADVRRDFIEPFFEALGWDVFHKKQRNPLEREVRVERSQQQAGATAQKRADYAFFLAPNFRDVRFFVEAKKPRIVVAKDKDAHFQTIRYGWNAHNPVAILTDFQEFLVLDSRYKPDIETALGRVVTAADGFTYSFQYRDFLDLEKLARVYWIFSYEAVTTGAFDRFADALSKPRRRARQSALLAAGQQPVDEQFLADLEQHRAALASAFKARNSELGGEELTEITQRTLDRLVFLRFLEDKLIETRFRVADFLKESNRDRWPKFRAAARQLDSTYNGIVFKEHPLLDSPSLAPEDEAFGDVLQWLSHTHSPYDFNSIPIHILGSIYERFLGTVIVATAKEAHPEVKPEVLKAHGVYYTPEYIVRYIVEHTVGNAIAGKKPSAIVEMRFADIACGSGSFLIAVYDYLLRFHESYYNEHPDEAIIATTKEVVGSRRRALKERIFDCVERDGVLHLTLEKKRAILLNNIFGVDIDGQAVEVTQLSLYLKLLESETTASARQFNLEFHEALLPTLSKNIIRGNSIVESDIGVLSESDERDLRPLDIPLVFEKVFPSGRSGNMSPLTTDLGPLFEESRGRERRATNCGPIAEIFGGFDAVVGNPPYVLMQELEQPRVFDYLSSKYHSARYKIDTYHVFFEQALRLCKDGGYVGYITPNSYLRNKHAEQLRRLILATSEPQILRLFFYLVFHGASVDTAVLITRRAANPRSNHNINVLLSRAPNEMDEKQTTTREFWSSHPKCDFGMSGKAGTRELLKKLTQNGVRLGSFATAYFGIQTWDRNKFVSTNRRFGKPVIDGVNIGRYSLSEPTEFVDFRPEAIKSGGKPGVYAQARIGVRQIGKTPIATFIPPHLYTLNTIYNVFFTKPTDYSLHFVLGIISSKCIGWFWETTRFDQKKTFPKIKKDGLLAIPIPKIDFLDETARAIHGKVVGSVEQILEARRRQAHAQTDGDKTFYAQKADALDREIDELVYKLFALSSEEIRLIEWVDR